MDEETDIELGMEEEDIYDEVEFGPVCSCGCSVFEGLKTVSSDVIILTCVNCGNVYTFTGGNPELYSITMVED